ncbi:hypothetical protein NC651_031121 [Populus alba x Populus x berolinensis]|nr:hypothetical protein NC651_031121 [Populus alba x Populus x berolinensis]
MYVYVYVYLSSFPRNHSLMMSFSSSITASRCLFGNLLVFNFKIIKISICQRIDKLILHKKLKILFYYLFFILTQKHIFC